MTVHNYLRMLAGALVLVGLALGYWVHEAWFLLTAFVGLNLFQSAFSDWCPAMTIIRKLGVPMCRHEANQRRDQAAGAAA
jgi:hypothetical protein